MRSYGQYCSVARALDVVGDRWTLLIVRELLARGPSRYTDLRSGLPGIATNLLADRLREMEAVGLVDREDAPPPVATTLFRLTQRGTALSSVISELGRWGVPLMSDYQPEDAFRGQWLRLPVGMFLADHEPDQAPSSIQIRAEDQTVTLDVAAGKISLRLGADPNADATITGPPPRILSLFSGRLALVDAEEQDVKVTGSRKAVQRILPRGEEAGLRLSSTVENKTS
ncbi:winged helix-turn-helix transcriptional regulator [Streptomyces sp. NBC_00233]|uniref:winged helix-turn-helix transcriptional regulator n=1 Tax=Streptomyces sp. NBC_00233 TaxID=2975686 RepID=UPI00224F93D3|nr:winged helix-turn-helix transcriptional regulator [Streptomyces sp. NBC_00233]MCX5233325.1 winged helix-turn-helix transcriptional regulator [Streptomyces sp. NBC_00233]